MGNYQNLSEAIEIHQKFIPSELKQVRFYRNQKSKNIFFWK